jgi:hypothetical protein
VNPHDTSYGLAYLIVLAAVYFIPAVVAYNRRHHNAHAIFMLDLLLGWTLLGWILALVWACTRPQPAGAQVVERPRPRLSHQLIAAAALALALLAIALLAALTH